jgi:tetratricopeptide (TPR) repeat protein
VLKATFDCYPHRYRQWEDIVFTRRVVQWGLALGVILWGMHVTQYGLRAYHRRELARRLVRALDDYEWKPIAALIRQGADPLTRGSDGTTVMARAASLGDLATLRAVLVRAQADSLFVARELPVLPSRKVDTYWSLPEMEDSLSRLVRQDGSERLVNAWIGLGLVRERLGRYPEAMQAYQQARRLDFTSQVAAEGEAQAERAAATAARIALTLPAGARILSVSPIETPERWAVVYGKPDKPQTGNQYAWVCAGLYRVSGSGAVPLAPPLAVRDPRFEDGARKAWAFSHDLTGDGKPELAIELVMQGASWSPSYLLVLSPGEGRWKQLLSLTSSEPLWLEDLNGDGTYEAGNSYEIGDHMSHAEQPRWEDLYAFEGDRYVLANHRFPQEFLAWHQTLNEVLAAHPEDPAILEYLGRNAEIWGQPAQARGYYQRAAQALLPDIAQSGNSVVYRAELRERQQALSTRLAALGAETLSSR